MSNDRPYIEAAQGRVKQLREELRPYRSSPSVGAPDGPWHDAAMAELAALETCLCQLEHETGWESADAMADWVLRRMFEVQA